MFYWLVWRCSINGDMMNFSNYLAMGDSRDIDRSIGASLVPWRQVHLVAVAKFRMNTCLSELFIELLLYGRGGASLVTQGRCVRLLTTSKASFDFDQRPQSSTHYSCVRLLFLTSEMSKYLDDDICSCSSSLRSAIVLLLLWNLLARFKSFLERVGFFW